MAVYLNNPKEVLQHSVRYKESTRDSDLKFVCKAIVKSWATAQEDQITISVVSGGITNLLYRVQHKTKSLLVRVYGENTEVLIDRVADNDVFAQMSALDFSPTYYGRFANGRIEGWLDARPLEPEEMAEPVMSGYIATEMGRMHTLDIDQPRNPVLWETLDKWMSGSLEIQFPEDAKKQKVLNGLRLTKIQEELKFMQSTIATGNGVDPTDAAASIQDRAAAYFSQSVFCHNDMLSGNVMTSDEWERVQLIDYEYGSYNFRGFDIGNHFCEYAGFDFNLAKWYPKPAQQRAFIERYMERASGPLLTALKEEGKLASFLDAGVGLVNQYAAASGLFWGLWAVMQAKHSPIDFDFIGYAKLRLDGYYAQKRQFCGGSSRVGRVVGATAVLAGGVMVALLLRKGGGGGVPTKVAGAALRLLRLQ